MPRMQLNSSFYEYYKELAILRRPPEKSSLTGQSPKRYNAGFGVDSYHRHGIISEGSCRCRSLSYISANAICFSF